MINPPSICPLIGSSAFQLIPDWSIRISINHWLVNPHFSWSLIGQSAFLVDPGLINPPELVCLDLLNLNFTRKTSCQGLTRNILLHNRLLNPGLSDSRLLRSLNFSTVWEYHLWRKTESKWDFFHLATAVNFVLLKMYIF